MLGLLAIRRRDIRTHQRWMGGNLKAAGMGFAWVINLLVAEWLVRRSTARSGAPVGGFVPV